MSDPFGSFEKPNPYGEAPFAGQPRPPYAHPGVPQGHAPQGPGPYGMPQRDPDRRPGTVLAAGIIAIVFSALATVAGIIMVIGGIVAQHWADDRFRGDYDYASRSDDHVLAIVLVVYGAIVVVLSVAAIVCAALLLRRSNAARIILVVLGGISILLSLAAITAIVPIVTIGAAIATIVLVFVGGANEWFRPRPQVVPYAPGPPRY